MSKKQLLDYLDNLVRVLINQKEELINPELIELRDKIKSILYNPDNIASIDFEKLDTYITVPYELLNYLTYYQMVVKTDYDSLTLDEKKYIEYSFQNFSEIIDRIIKEKEQEIEGSTTYSGEIAKLNDIRNILISKINFDLDDFTLIIRIIKSMKTNYEKELIDNMSLYMQYIMKINCLNDNEEMGKGKR